MTTKSFILSAMFTTLSRWRCPLVGQTNRRNDFLSPHPTLWQCIIATWRRRQDEWEYTKLESVSDRENGGGHFSFFAWKRLSITHGDFSSKQATMMISFSFVEKLSCHICNVSIRIAWVSWTATRKFTSAWRSSWDVVKVSDVFHCYTCIVHK